MTDPLDRSPRRRRLNQQKELRPKEPPPLTPPRPPVEEETLRQPLIPPPPEGRRLSYYATEKLRSLVGELARRRAESLRLYEPLPEQQRFHSSMKMERLLRGSNRGGKTLPAAVEVARAVTGCDPFSKYPREHGRCIAVGKDGKHIGETMWRKLGHARAFKIIRGEDGLWRAFRPWDPRDLERETEARPAPPLIPPRMIRSISWYNKKLGQPEKVTLHTGWEILFFSSLGKPPQGTDVDLVWFDEEIEDQEWYPEMVARLADRMGRFIWSATPQAATEQLFDLHCRAEDGDELVEEFIIRLRDNPHIAQQAKEQMAAKLSEDERLIRIEGEFAIHGLKVYPEFRKEIHCCPEFTIPEHWMRLVAIDPGRQVCAALFAAVPPPEEGDFVYFYDELYIRSADAEKFGQGMELKCRHHSFRVFLIDSHGARIGEIGTGKSVEQQYSRALERHRVSSELTGHGFKWGSDDPEAGRLAFRGWLLVRPDSTTKLRVFRDRCPNFINEIERYHHKRVKGVITDEVEKKRDHLMDCARHLAMYDPKYHKPKPAGKRENPILALLRKKKEKRLHKEGRRGVHLGPGGGEYGTGRPY